MISLVRNFNKLLLAALLVGAAGTALAGTPCGTNLEYEIVGTTLILTSSDPAADATIYASAFKDKTFSTSFTKVIIPENVTQINSAAFYGCTGLTEVVIPTNVTLIGPEAFKGCTSLARVLCRPTTAPSLGTEAFTGCHASLLICVPALSSYNDPLNEWYQYSLTLCFLDENNEETITSEQIKQIRDTYHQNDIDIFRTLRKAGSFNTLTLPFNVSNIESSPLAGAEVYTFSSATVEDGTLQLEIEKVASNSLTAGVPYLIQWPNTGEVLNHLYFSDITWDNDQSASTASSTYVNYVGFYGKTHVSDDENHSNLFLLGNNTLYWPTDGDDPAAKMLGFRAYFHVNTSGPSLAPLYRGMPASLRIKATPTDIENVQQDEVSCRKELRNGQLVIIRNGETFSINGQKL